MEDNIVWFDVESSNVRAIGHDIDESQDSLYVKFYDPKGRNADSVYWYSGAYPDLWDSFIAAPSKGQFVWAYLRGQYEYGRLF